MKESIITHAPGSRFVLIREDYLAITEANTCQAALLNYFEQWANSKINSNDILKHEQERAKKANTPFPDHLLDDIWIYRPIDQIADDMLGVFSSRTIQHATEALVHKHFLERRRNPLYKWDRTWQYQINPKNVQKAVHDSSGKNDTLHPAKTTPCIRQKRHLASGKNDTLHPVNLPNRNGKFTESKQQIYRSNTLDVLSESILESSSLSHPKTNTVDAPQTEEEEVEETLNNNFNILEWAYQLYLQKSKQANQHVPKTARKKFQPTGENNNLLTKWLTDWSLTEDEVKLIIEKTAAEYPSPIYTLAFYDKAMHAAWNARQAPAFTTDERGIVSAHKSPDKMTRDERRAWMDALAEEPY